ncbi:MAG TPA: hypothetical protein VM070_03655 [Candidatus Saccharimonadales bacterium]|nr:hypothetical protein [Candidatus Saccharimonadales bacterium]
MTATATAALPAGRVAHPAAEGLRTGPTLVLFAAFVLGFLVALRLDSAAGAELHLAVGIGTWAFLLGALTLQSPRVRVQVAILVIIATTLEVVGSLVWGAYRYRLGDLPLFVPAGHGIFYLVALRTAALPWILRRQRGIVWTVSLAATAYMVWGLLRPPLPDLLGFVTWAILIRFMARGRAPLLYAVSFVLTMALELYGTSLGVWTWAPLLPGLWLPAGNPPTGVGAGYCVMDALTRRTVATFRRYRRTPPPPLAEPAGPVTTG